MTPEDECRAIECPLPPTHYSPRMDAAYCLKHACWAEGFSLRQAAADHRLVPIGLGRQPSS